MNLPYLTRQLRDNARRIRVLVEGVTLKEARWKPDPEFWSMLEVVNHLYDEEREDFRVRLDIILHEPEREFPPINPQGWVTERAYNQREIEPSLQNFIQERGASLEWLESLSASDWDKVTVGPFGSMRAGDMLASWVTHDHLHMRQLVELHRAYTVVQSEPYDLEYAGTW